MLNAKKELENHINLICRDLKIDKAVILYRSTVYELPPNYDEETLDRFFRFMDFEYDNSYGMQELSGVIWFKDGTWAERCEYDGCEWWAYRSLPDFNSIVENFKGIKNFE